MDKFRTQLLAATSLLALSGAAYAADMPVKAPPPPMAPPVIPWTGFYAGLQIGGASLDPSCHSFSNFPTLLPVDVGLDPCLASDFEGVTHSGSLSSASVIGGGKIGYDWQWGWAVLGVVGEFDWTHLNGTENTFNSPDAGDVLSAGDRINWLASARGRIGWTFGALDNFMVYATGGVAWADIKATSSLVDPVCPECDFSTQSSSTKTGGVFGAGFEYRVFPHVSVVGEVLWYDFGSTTVNTVLPFDTAFTYSTQFKYQDVVTGTLGVNYRF